MTETITEIPVGSYEKLAAEYYDVARHPTCANFRQASQYLLERLTPDVASERCCEIGAGDSLLADVLTRRGRDLTGLRLTDAHLAMLEYSRRWERLGAILAVAKAAELPVPDASLGLLVASLADPYDDDALWSEAARVLEPGALCLLTAPSWVWASRFRSSRQPGRAEFELRDGTIIEAPSHVRPPSDERQLIESHGLRVIRQAEVQLDAIHEPISEKLKMLHADDPVVTGFLVLRPPSSR